MIMIADLMLTKLVNKLSKVNWLYKADLYTSFVEYIQVNKEVVNPTISIVIISWQYNELMLKNFESLNKQRHNNFELIFVNNGKADQEFSYILPYVDTYIKLNTNTGAYKARNIGAVFAHAPLLFFLEDDGVADNLLVQSHIEAYNFFDIISLRGVCKPLNKDNKLNKLAKHYYLGPRPFPRYVDLEGNASYRSEAFFAVGGWSDDIEFGHGGLELSIRLSKKYPNKNLQIYSPKPIIFHDYAKDNNHLKAKLIKQRNTLNILRKKYLDWDSYNLEYKKLQGQSHRLAFLNYNAILYNKYYFIYKIEKCRNFLIDPIIYFYRKIRNLLPQGLQNLIKENL